MTILDLHPNQYPVDTQSTLGQHSVNSLLSVDQLMGTHQLKISQLSTRMSMQFRSRVSGVSMEYPLSVDQGYR